MKAVWRVKTSKADIHYELLYDVGMDYSAEEDTMILHLRFINED